MYVQHQPTYQLGFVMMSERVFCCLGRGRATCTSESVTAIVYSCVSLSAECVLGVRKQWTCDRVNQRVIVLRVFVVMFVCVCVCLIELFFRILFGVSGRFVSGISLLLLLLLLYCVQFLYFIVIFTYFSFFVFFSFLVSHLCVLVRLSLLSLSPPFVRWLDVWMWIIFVGRSCGWETQWWRRRKMSLRVTLHSGSEELFFWQKAIHFWIREVNQTIRQLAADDLSSSSRPSADLIVYQLLQKFIFYNLSKSLL